MPNYNKFSSGQEYGTHFIPTETDVSIRPGWYYHPEEDNKVKIKLLFGYKNKPPLVPMGECSFILSQG